MRWWNKVLRSIRTMGSPKHFKPGDRCRRSGQYEIVDRDGTRTGEKRAISRGDKFPRTPKRQQTFVLAHPARPWLADLVYFSVWLAAPVGAVGLAPLALPPVLRWLGVRWPGGLTTSTYILAVVVWSALVFVAWIVIGDGSSAHETNFAKYKSIWVSFVLIALVLFLANSLAYSGVVSRVKALRGTASLLASTISNPSNQQASVEYWVDRGLDYSKKLNSQLRDAETFEDVDAQRVGSYQRSLHGYAFQSRQFADLAYELARNLVQRERALKNEGIEAKGTSFEPLLFIATELVTTTQQLDKTFTELMEATETTKSGGEAGMRDLRIKGVELTNHYYQAQALIRGAKATLAAGDVNLLAPFIWITVLYVVFLLFPWVLLFLFLLRKREYLVNEKAQLLCKLGLAREFLERSPRQDVRDAAKRDPVDRGVVAEEVSGQAFRNSEYVVSLTLLTAITAAVWYFFFYPHATSGLANLISQGGSVKALADYLASDATPITFGFIGAYFFVIQMLLRRYFAADLNPKAYIYAVVRLLTVFILSLFLQLAMPFHNWTSFGAVAAAFVVGIFPRAGLRWILYTANEVVKKLKAPEYVDRYPLTKLDGLNTWHEARLLEEKVENVQNLATTSLDDLIIHTNFSPLQLVDWVDQALLFVHTQERWNDAFRAVGIRTATDLLDNTRGEGTGRFDPDAARDLATAINAAQAFIEPEPGHPRQVARLAAAALYKSVADAAAMAKEAHNMAKTLVGDEPATLDAVVALQAKLGNVAEAAKQIKDEKVKKVTQAAEKLPADGGDLIKRGKDAVGEVEKSAAALSAEADAAKQAAGRLDRKRSETLTQLTEVKERIGAVCAAAANLKAQAVSAIEIAQKGAEGTTAKTEWAALRTALEATQKASEQVLEEAQKVREAATPLDRDKPETLNMVVALQTRLNALYKAAGDTQAKMKEARAAVEGLQATQPLLAEARKSLDAAAESANDLATAATAAKDAAAALDVDAPATMAGLSGAKESVEQAWKAAEEAKTRGQTAAGALQAASAPPQMTWQILKAMVKTIEKGLNIRKLQGFWKEQGE